MLQGGAFTPINLKAAAELAPNGKMPAHIGLFAEAAKHLTATNQTKNTIGARSCTGPRSTRPTTARSRSATSSQMKPQVENALKGS